MNIRASNLIISSGSYLWVISQIYVGTFNILLGETLFNICLTTILIANLVIVLKLINANKKASLTLKEFGANLAIVVGILVFWKVLYSLPNQEYKFLWLGIGYLTPVWTIFSAVLAIVAKTYKANFEDPV